MSRYGHAAALRREAVSSWLHRSTSSRNSGGADAARSSACSVSNSKHCSFNSASVFSVSVQGQGCSQLLGPPCVLCSISLRCHVMPPCVLLIVPTWAGDASMCLFENNRIYGSCVLRIVCQNCGCNP